jgi:hypothetical protein
MVMYYKIVQYGVDLLSSGTGHCNLIEVYRRFGGTYAAIIRVEEQALQASCEHSLLALINSTIKILYFEM